MSEPAQKDGVPLFKAPHEATRVPGPIAIALMTGRPEMAQIGMQEIAIKAKGTPLEALAQELVDFAVGCVRDIQHERDIFTALAPALDNARTNLIGSLGAVERLQDAVELIQQGADPAAIREALKSRNEKLRERRGY